MPAALEYWTATELAGLIQFRNFISANCATGKQKRLIVKFVYVNVVNRREC